MTVDFDALLEMCSVHPAAAAQPKPSDAELEELAADIRANGLIHPIVLDPQGQILDGRSRLVACEMAGVAPHYETYAGDNPAWYALTVNINRRHLKPGQRYMLVELARRSSGIPNSEFAVPANRLSEAAVVVDHAPDLIEQVVSGELGLAVAAATARQRKRPQPLAEPSDAVPAAASDAAADHVAEPVASAGSSLVAAVTQAIAETFGQVHQRDEAAPADPLLFAETASAITSADPASPVAAPLPESSSAADDPSYCDACCGPCTDESTVLDEDDAADDVIANGAGAVVGTTPQPDEAALLAAVKQAVDRDADFMVRVSDVLRDVERLADYDPRVFAALADGRHMALFDSAAAAFDRFVVTVRRCRIDSEVA